MKVRAKPLFDARKAVETGFVALWEYTPRAGLRLTRRVDALLPVRDYLETVGKYRHLDAAQLAHIQRRVEQDIGFLKELAACAPQAELRAPAG